MKTLLLLATAALLPLSVSYGGGPIGGAGNPVYDAASDINAQSQIDRLDALKVLATSTLNTANNSLDQLKTLATSQGKVETAIKNVSDKIDGLTTVIGNPADAKTKVHYDDVKNQIQNWIDHGAFAPNPAHDSGISNPTKADDGDQAFNATAGGLFDKIGDTYKPDPTKDATEPRDKKLYAGQVDTLAAVSQYYDSREAAMARRTELQNLLKDALDGLKNAEDFATVSKQTALVSTIESQLQACNDDINSSFNEVAVRALQMFTMSQVQQIASNEVLNKQMKNKLDAVTDGITGHAATPAGSASTGTPPAVGSKASGGTFDTSLLYWKSYTY